MQCGYFQKAEDVFTEGFKVYKEALDNLNIADLSLNNDDETNEFPIKADFGVWEQGLVESYKNTNKWNNILSFSEEVNNFDLKVEALWHLGKWDDIDSMNLQKHHYFSKINQIYMMMKQDTNRADSTYQQKCMECIRTMFSEFSIYPPNFEKLNYSYFLIFQLIVEAWESTNTLKEIERNISERKPSDFRENLIMWRDRVPHYCEGYYNLKTILEPRNYLFSLLRDLLKGSINSSQLLINAYPNVSDHIWNNMMCIKYARKLNLMDVYNEQLDIFNKSIIGLESSYSVELYNKNLEHFKFIRNNRKDFAKGLELADELLKTYNLNNPGNYSNETSEIKASYLGAKGYFSFRLGKVIEAHECFKEAVKNNQTDYKIWLDWAEMSEYILNNVSDNKIEAQWFENSIINYFMVIIFKLDKAKFIIPRILRILLKYNQYKIIDQFNKLIDNIPSWVWLFWLPQLFELSYSNSHYIMSIYIIKKIAVQYPQSVYYPLSCHYNSNIDDSGIEIKKYFEEIRKIIDEKDKHVQAIPKIEIIIGEIKNKLIRNSEEIMLNHLVSHLDIEGSNNLKDAREKISVYLNKLKQKHTSSAHNFSDFIVYLENLLAKKEFTLFDLYSKLKSWRYHLQSLISTQSNFGELINILNNKLYNLNFEEVEIPGFYSNKIVEPTNENRIYITRFESEFSFKFANFSSRKLVIRGMNEKLFNFSIIYENFREFNDNLSQLQALLNSIFASNKDTYKSNVKFNIPIRCSLNKELKIVQEEISQYYLNEVFEFEMQKCGFDPEVAYLIYNEELEKLQKSNLKLQSNNFSSLEVLSNVYARMNKLLPIYSLKNFIHKFIINCDEIFIFRKQFSTSYALNSLIYYLFKTQKSITLNKISFNKETGSVTFHHSTLPIFDDFNKNNLLQKDIVPFRITRNINVFYFYYLTLVFHFTLRTFRRISRNHTC